MHADHRDPSPPPNNHGNGMHRAHGPDLEDQIADYLERINQGEAIDPAEVLAENPEHGPAILDALEGFIDLTFDDPTASLGTLGDYTLRRQIARGGMGVVYEAWDHSMDRSVALKVLPVGIAVDSRATTRFLREAQTAGRLNHPNVVGVYSTGVKEGIPWYAMEYVDGESLAQVLARIKDSDPETETPFGKKGDTRYFANLAEAFADVADGLQHAHTKSVTHRDIKPSNLILDGDGRLRILDFGLARLDGQESLTVSGDVVGTPLYMSPEQARRKKIPVDHRTDIYSLGATMYETICGRPPFRGKDHADTLSQIIERDPVELRKIDLRVPRDLETIVLKCLRKDSSDRYGTAEALGQDLRRFVRGDPIEARQRPAWLRIGSRIARRRRSILTRILMTFLLLVAGFFASLVFVDEQETETGHFANLVSVSEVNSPQGEGCPTLSADGLELYFASKRPGGKGDYDIYVVRRPDSRSLWGKATNVEELNTSAADQPAWLSSDNLQLYYVNYDTETDREKDIRHATWNKQLGRWEQKADDVLLAINTEHYDGDPTLTADELTMYFCSNRDHGVGRKDKDIWYATRPAPSLPWETPRNLEEINSGGDETEPCISSDALTLWWTNRGVGKSFVGQIFYATRATTDGRFGSPKLVDPPVNSHIWWDGQFEVSRSWPADGSVAFLLRGGSVEGMDIYEVTWIAGPNPNPAPDDIETSGEGRTAGE